MRPDARPDNYHYAVLHLVVLVWGITAILGKLIALDPAVLTAWRTGIAALVLLIILAWRRELWPGWRAAGLCTATGLLIGLHWFLFFRSGRQGSVSASLAGVSTMALWVALLEPMLVRGRRWSWAEGLLAAGVALGVLVIQLRGPDASGGFTLGDGGPLSGSGLFTGILAAGVAALFSIINARLVRHHPAMVITAFEMIGACALCLAGASLFGSAEGLNWWPDSHDWPWLLTLALVCTVFAYSACVWVQRRVSAFSVGMASNLEPIYGMALAPLVFGAVEHQKLQFYAGSAVIIACVALHTLLAGKRRQQGFP